jgi:hypothetical protein
MISKIDRVFQRRTRTIDTQTTPDSGVSDAVLAPSKIVPVLLAIWKYLLIPVLTTIFSIVIFARIEGWWRGPSTYKIYVVGNFSGHDPVTEAIWKGFNEKYSTNLKIDGINVAIEKVDDKGTVDNAKQISQVLAKRDDTLMVVGHIFSSQTEAALPAYLGAKPPIPVLLTVETNPNLLPTKFAEEHTYFPLFRLSPTDKEQARTAADFISKDVRSFWVVEDSSNSVYSRFLVREFITQIQEKGKGVVLLSNNTAIPSVDTLKTFDIKCIFFVGHWSNALILLEQIKAIWPDKKTRPKVLLSDSSADVGLIEYGQREDPDAKGKKTDVLTKADVLEGVYLTNAMDADHFNKLGYKVYGLDAYTIAENLIRSADTGFSSKIKKEGKASYWTKQLLSMHRVRDARKVISSTMEEAAIWSPYQFEGQVGASYRFGKNGDREDAKFHIWRVRQGEFVEEKVQ